VSHKRAPSAELLVELGEIAVETASIAATLLLERFQEGVAREVHSKSTPTDLVSAADLEAERYIRETLAERRPQDGFLGEEGGEVKGSSGLRWVVDPLDGTVNFLFGIPQWCVSVAVEDEDGALAAAIVDPIRQEIFSALRGGSPILRAPGRQSQLGISPQPSGAQEQHVLQPSERADLQTAMLATGLAYDATVRAAQAQVLARVMPQVRDIRRFGSAALDLAWTAAGRYDAYFERTVKPWDIAAGVLICQTAGLVVHELPLHPDLPWGILVAPAAIAGQLLELVGAPAQTDG
jgi:myo-inositol-1(or 4)-monophosphatase